MSEITLVKAAGRIIAASIKVGGKTTLTYEFPQIPDPAGGKPDAGYQDRCAQEAKALGDLLEARAQ